MLILNDYYIESLASAELDFLKKKANKQAFIYIRIVQVLMLGALLVSFAGAWENVQQGRFLETKTVFSWKYYFLTLCSLSLIFFVILRVAQTMGLKLLRKDIKQKAKIVERVLIKKKTFLPHNNTFHFYINSALQISIQVSEFDFNALSEGDEISIEYSQYAGVYFGYF
jgi:hypothetical protein